MCNQLIWTHICTLIKWSGCGDGMGKVLFCSKVIIAYTLIGWIFDLNCAINYNMNLLAFDSCSVVGEGGSLNVVKLV